MRDETWSVMDTLDVVKDGGDTGAHGKRCCLRTRSRTQLLLAELMWSVVGLGLLALGAYWVVRRYGDPGLAYTVPFLAAGLGKGLLVLDRVARRTIERVRAQGDGHWAWAFFSVRSWAVVLLMIALGNILRASPIPRADLGFLYVLVGTALLFSSRSLWKAWLRWPSLAPPAG